MSKEPNEQDPHISVLEGRLRAQSDIILAMLGYFIVHDESFARGLIRAIATAAENVEQMVGDNGYMQTGYTSEIVAFSVKALHRMGK